MTGRRSSPGKRDAQKKPAHLGDADRALDTTPAGTWEDPRVILRRAEILPDATLGQNFLVNRGVVEKIVSLLEPLSGRTVLEVGPGLGHLTEGLAARAARVVALDLDPRMVNITRSRLASFGDRVFVAQGDATKLSLSSLVAGDDRELVATGNLPFYCSSEILLRLLDDIEPALVVVMVQKEVARRMAAAPGGKEYGALSIACQVRAEVCVAFDIRPGSFYPKPDVSASVVTLAPGRRWPIETLLGLERVTKTLFGLRRKKLRSALKKAGWLDALLQDPATAALAESGLRPERLEPRQFLEITWALDRQMGALWRRAPGARNGKVARSRGAEPSEPAPKGRGA